MLDPIVAFVTRIFQWIGRGLGYLIGILLWPFLWFGSWYARKGWMLKAIVGAVVAGIVALYAYFFYATQFWNDFDPDYPQRYLSSTQVSLAGAPVGETGAAAIAQAQSTAPGTSAPATAPAPATPAAPANACNRSELVSVTSQLIDFNVNRNRWVPSMILSKLGLFGIPWKNTPYMDNKAAFQLGINQAMRRTSTELVDTLGRVRGTAQIDSNLQEARTALAWDEEAWYIGFRGPTRPTPGVYRDAIGHLNAFNDKLAQCQTVFDARADNLLTYIDRVAGDLGSTSDILRQRLDESNLGWFDPRADDRFWFAYGQLYAYYGLLAAAKVDFAAVIQERNLTRAWEDMTTQLRTALNMQPWIISNGRESSTLFPSHLATMGFYVLRVRSQLIEIRSILDR